MSTRMTKSAFLALQLATALALLTAPAFSQTGDSASAAPKHSLHAGAWALQFSVGSNFTLGTFDGTTISIQKHTSDRAAWRLGVSISGNVSRQDFNMTTLQDTVTQSSDHKSNNDSQAIRLGLTRVVYPRTPSRLNVYYGLGPRLSYGRDHQEIFVSYPNKSIHTQTTWSAGAGLLLGVLYFPAKGIGLSAEYGT
ncbi:MAG: outer membrane beta-barrel protein, partial [candidate division Zixibacteria bacterium]|nr:outer membrane beta-barrel protein [candidate division Zixibacteria bacterium]